MSRLKSTSMDRVHSGQRQCDISSWRISRHPTPPAGPQTRRTHDTGGWRKWRLSAHSIRCHHSIAGLHKRGRPVSRIRCMTIILYYFEKVPSAARCIGQLG